MKKTISLLLTSLLILSSLTVSAFAASSLFGYGVEVMANDVTMIKTGLLGKKLTFNDADFKTAMCIDDFKSITVTSVPSSSEGTLLIGGRRVCKGRVIKQKMLGALVFVPASDKVAEARFSFTSEGNMGGGEMECIMRFTDRVNYAPEVDKAACSEVVNTQENITVFASLTAKDPEGDKLEYIIVSYPKRGICELTDSESGRFTYTPNEGYTGRDSFVFSVRDEYGNYSEPVKVTLRVNKRMCDTVYADMIGREEYNGAVALTAMGVMDGRLIGDDMYFLPEEQVSRAEFVTLCLKSLGIKADSTLSSTYFDDDSEIPQSLRGYISTAQRLGYIGGDFKNGRLLFSPNEPITRYEAAKIMASMLGKDSAGEEDVFADEDETPVWARSGVSAMKMLGIFDDGDAKESAQAVSRADAAEYLYRLIKTK